MGVDVEIFFQCDGQPEFERDLPAGFKVCGIPDYQQDFAPGSTHSIGTLERYYGPGYERGSWPDICSVLMLLHACPQVSKVWYGGDSYDPPECTVDDVLEISRHFMEHGERPYRDR